MKSKFFLLALSSAMVIHISAQVQVGIMGGPQFSIREYNKTIADNEFITSVNAGIMSIIPLSEKIKLQANFGYSGKGVILKNFTFSDGGGNIEIGDINILLHYLELRSPIDYCIDLSTKSTLLIGAGPYFSYAVGGHQKIKNNDFFASFLDRELNFEDEYNRFEFGITGNISLQFRQKWLLGIDTDIGLTDIFKMKSLKTISHRSFSFTLGYLFWNQKKKENKK